MSNARDVARRVLQRVEEGAFATLALGGELERSRLERADRGLATELVYGVLRWRRRLDAALAAYAPRGLGGVDKHTLNTLRIAAFELLILETPAHAAVDQAVDAIRRGRSQKLAGFANALLRRLSRDGEPKHATLAERVSAPDWLVERARAAVGDAETEAFLLALNRPAPLWLRLNRKRTEPDALDALIAAELPDGLRHPSLRYAVKLPPAGDPTQLPIWQRGLASIQDIAAQLVGELAQPQQHERALDVCAGVGGKSGDLAERGLAVVALDLSERKLALCRDAAHRLGLDARITTQLADATALDTLGLGQFDLVLVDAPCSGSGVLRRHPEAKWRPAPDATTHAALQRRILDAAARAVRPGGRLVYAVCSFLPEEGLDLIKKFVADQPRFRLGQTLHTWPHHDDGDAFFAALLWCDS